MDVGGTVAVQLPALCPMRCDFCRTPQHGDGDPKAVREAVMARARPNVEIYLTSNGETGLYPGYHQLVSDLTTMGATVSALCATQCSVVSGLKRIEISWNLFTRRSAEAAITEARRLGIPVVASLVDTGVESIDLQAVADRLSVDGVLVRSLQREGRAKQACGRTQIWQRPGLDLGNFPICAYQELAGLGTRPECIDHYGRIVPYLGTPL